MLPEHNLQTKDPINHIGICVNSRFGRRTSMLAAEIVGACNTVATSAQRYRFYPNRFIQAVHYEETLLIQVGIVRACGYNTRQCRTE